MKRLLSAFAFFALLLIVGCDQDPDEIIPENIFFGLDKESISISPDGGGVDVIVYSNYKWEISGASEWCTPSVKSGEANVDGQKVTFTADVAYDDREAIFWFRCADEKIKFTVKQQFNEAIIPDENNTLHIPAEGGVATLAYQTTVDCEVIIPEDAKDWISIASANTRGLVAENITLDIAENTTYSARSAVVKVVMIGNESIVAEYTIKQSQVDAVIADGEHTFNVSSLGGDVTIKYQTNVECEVQIPEEAQEWIAIAPATTRALVQESTQLHIAANDTGQDRSAVVKVVANGNQDILAEYTITQYWSDVLYYTSVDGEIVTPYNSEAFGATILSNTYSNGKGIIKFNGNLTSIEGSAFRYCSSLQSITIPESVTSIGDYAFRGCASLQSVTIPESVTSIGWWAFYGCSALESITIPDGVTSIGDNAFYDCRSLQSITIPDSITSIGDSAFYGCKSLRSITIPEGVTSIGDEAFLGCSSLAEFKGKFASSDGRCLIIDGTLNSFAPAGLTKYSIPESVTSIGEWAFRNCSSLQSITIPESVTSIGESAFEGCTGELIINSKIVEKDYHYNNYPQKEGWLEGAKFTKLTIGNSVTSIGDYTFQYCSSLQSITIPDSVTEIGDYAFGYCRSLESVTIGNGVTSIGGSAFEDCSSLKDVYISDIVTWCNIDFVGGASNPLCEGARLHLNGELVTVLNIPDSIIAIKQYAFRGCSSLASITIPESVTSIGDDAFLGCSSLRSITIGNGVTSIGDYAFYGCSSLQSVTIGNSVTSIGSQAFRSCSSLASITIPESVTSIGHMAFWNCTGELIINSKIVEKDYIIIQTQRWLEGAKFTKLTIGNGVTSIGSPAFYGCSSLQSVTIGNGVTSIGHYAFSGCSSLAEYKGKFASSDGRCLIIYGTLNSFAPAGLTEYTIPDSVTSIGYSAFYGCSGLESITIPDGVTSIGSQAFRSCSSLASITIPDSIRKIGDYAFYGCSSLQSVTIGNSVTSIGERAFYFCSSLGSVYCKPTTPPNGGYSMFDYNALGRMIYVPSRSVEAYTTASNWSVYKSNIFGYYF